MEARVRAQLVECFSSTDKAPALQRWRHENQKLKGILSYLVDLGQPVIYDTQKKRRKERKKEGGRKTGELGRQIW